MKNHTVSMSIAWDWNTKPANDGDVALMNDVRKMFSKIDMDTYARNSEDSMPIWVLRGETVWNLRSFTMQLTDLMPSFDIVYLTHSQKRG